MARCLNLFYTKKQNICWEVPIENDKWRKKRSRHSIDVKLSNEITVWVSRRTKKKASKTWNWEPLSKITNGPEWRTRVLVHARIHPCTCTRRQMALVWDLCSSKKRTVVGKSDGFFNVGLGAAGVEGEEEKLMEMYALPVEHIHESFLTSTPLQANDQTEPRRSSIVQRKMCVLSVWSSIASWANLSCELDTFWLEMATYILMLRKWNAAIWEFLERLYFIQVKIYNEIFRKYRWYIGRKYWYFYHWLFRSMIFLYVYIYIKE